jgi:hypothetical protein
MCRSRPIFAFVLKKTDYHFRRIFANTSTIPLLNFQPFNMGSVYETEKQTFVIPSVNVSAYLADPNSSDGQKVIEQVRDGCRTSGFFQITGHGVPSSLRDAVLDAAKTFFKLPLDEKAKYSSVPGRGYERIGEQILEPGTKPELKEVCLFSTKENSLN